MKIMFLTLGFLLTSILVYSDSYKSGFFFSSNTKTGFLFTGVNVPFQFFEDVKTNAAPIKNDYSSQLRKMSTFELSNEAAAASGAFAEDTKSVDAAEKFIRVNAEFGKRLIETRDTLKKAYKKVYDEEKSKENDLSELTKKVILVFFLTYDTQEHSEISQYYELVVRYFTIKGFACTVVVSGVKDRMNLSDQVINSAFKVIVDSDNRLATGFDSKYPSIAAHIQEDNTAIPLFDTKVTADVIGESLVRQYKYYKKGDLIFKKITFME